MIFRKPYAFLIKNFRIIHIILTLLAVYMLNQTGSIYTFFSKYISNGYTAVITDNLSSSFVNISVVGLLFLLIGVLVGVAALLTYKKKNNKVYFISIAYYVLLIGCFIFYYSVFNAMEKDVITADQARLYTDVSLMFYLPQYVFVVIYGVRALGFNVKQFNFKKDLIEMDLADEDSEEVELNIEFDGYKTKRTFRRFIREMRYYILENLVFFIIISSVLIFTISYNIITNLSFFNNSYYKTGEKFNYESFDLTFNNAIVTDKNIGGKEIAGDKYFLAIPLTLENNTTRDKEIDINDFKLMLNGKLVTPSNEYSNLFSDYGRTLIHTNIKNKSKNNYVIVYVINKEDVRDDFSIRLYTGTYTKGDVLYPIYSIVDIDQSVLKISSVSTIYKLENKINFTDTNIKNSSFMATGYEINNMFYYDYEKCSGGVCSSFKESIYIDYTKPSQTDKTVLALESELIIDKSTTYFLNNKSNFKFFDNSLTFLQTV